MEWWQITLIAIGSAMIVLIALVIYLWRKATAQTKQLASRLQKLPWRAKLNLAVGIMTDPDVPLRARVVPPLLIAYLSMPIDIIPDFLPVIGQIDDVLVLAVGLGLMLNSIPVRVLEARITALERAHDIGSRRTIDA